MTIAPEILGAVLGASITALAGIAVFFFKQQSQRTHSANIEKLNYLNQQISELHGPVFALSNAARLLWESMAQEMNRSPDSLLDFMFKNHAGEQCDPTVSQLQDWKRWIREIFRPIDEAREKILLEKYHLAWHREDVDPAIPVSKLVAHVAGFKELMKTWETQHSDEDTWQAWLERGPRAFIPSNDFPKEATLYIRLSYEAVKKERDALMPSINR